MKVKATTAGLTVLAVMRRSCIGISTGYMVTMMKMTYLSLYSLQKRKKRKEFLSYGWEH